MIRRLIPLALVAVALGAGACSSSASSTSTSTTTTAASTTTTAKATTTTAKSTAWCSTTSLSITAGAPSGAAGHVIVQLSFKNTSSATCVTGGFPGVAGTNSSGTQVIQATRVGTSYGTFSLAPGKAATANVSAVNVPSGTATSCSMLNGLVVTPPNTVTSTHLVIELPGCPGLSVTAIAAS